MDEHREEREELERDVREDEEDAREQDEAEGDRWTTASGYPLLGWIFR